MSFRGRRLPSQRSTSAWSRASLYAGKRPDRLQRLAGSLKSAIEARLEAEKTRSEVERYKAETKALWLEKFGCELPTSD